MALNEYLSRTRSLLQTPSAPNSLYNTTDLTSAINQARGQLAGEAECIRVLGSLSVSSGNRAADFTSISYPSVSSVSGIAGALNVRQALYSVATGSRWITPRSWEWFTFFKLNAAIPRTGAPETWAQLGQGVNGSIYVDPVPDIGYTITVDVVAYPNTLVTNDDVEAIPYLWTDAVAYFAAYLTLLGAQNAARQADADRMFERYQEFVQRARRASTASVLPGQYLQAPDPTTMNKLGLTPTTVGGAAGIGVNRA